MFGGDLGFDSLIGDSVSGDSISSVRSWVFDVSESDEKNESLDNSNCIGDGYFQRWLVIGKGGGEYYSFSICQRKNAIALDTVPFASADF